MNFIQQVVELAKYISDLEPELKNFGAEIESQVTSADSAEALQNILVTVLAQLVQHSAVYWKSRDDPCGPIFAVAKLCSTFCPESAGDHIVKLADNTVDNATDKPKQRAKTYVSECILILFCRRLFFFCPALLFFDTGCAEE